jgi:hypothetical protein
MNTMIARALFLAFALPAAPALASDAAGSFAVKDVGLARCENFMEAVKTKDKGQIARYVGWLGGFLTATNQRVPETFDLTPWQNSRTLTAYLANHCGKNPDLRFGAAVVQLSAALHEDRLREKSDLVPIEHEGQTHYVYREALRRAQAVLADRGMYSGNMDGEFNEETRTALKAFQGEKALNETGLPDQETLFRLLQKDG